MEMAAFGSNQRIMVPGRTTAKLSFTVYEVLEGLWAASGEAFKKPRDDPDEWQYVQTLPSGIDLERRADGVFPIMEMRYRVWIATRCDISATVDGPIMLELEWEDGITIVPHPKTRLAHAAYLAMRHMGTNPLDAYAVMVQGRYTLDRFGLRAMSDATYEGRQREQRRR
jgi:hypothetical protein